MLELVVARIRENIGDLKSVDMAENLDLVVAGTSPDDGDVFVIPYREKASPNKLATGFRQLVNVQIAVTFVVRHHGDVHGSERAARFDSYKRSIEDALAGWEPTDDSEPFQLVAGEGTPLGNNTTIYVQTWETTRFLTKDF